MAGFIHQALEVRRYFLHDCIPGPPRSATIPQSPSTYAREQCLKRSTAPLQKTWQPRVSAKGMSAALRPSPIGPIQIRSVLFQGVPSSRPGSLPPRRWRGFVAVRTVRLDRDALPDDALPALRSRHGSGIAKGGEDQGHMATAPVVLIVPAHVSSRRKTRRADLYALRSTRSSRRFCSMSASRKLLRRAVAQYRLNDSVSTSGLSR